jgi:hypothetical protein
MKLSDYKVFFECKKELDSKALEYLNSKGMPAKSAKIVDIYEKFVVVAFKSPSDIEEVISISIWSLIEPEKGLGCRSCRK